MILNIPMPPNPAIEMPIHGTFGWGESAASWATWCLLHADDYAEAGRLFFLRNDGLVRRIWQGNNGKPAGSPAGCKGNGYLHTRFKGSMVPVHHLVWLLAYGRWPRHPLVLDHINGDKVNNSITNLREVTQQWNCLLGKRAKTKSELPYGVSVTTRNYGKDMYAYAKIKDKTGKLRNNYININDPLKREKKQLPPPQPGGGIDTPNFTHVERTTHQET